MLATQTMLTKKQSYETTLSSSHDEDFRKCYKSYQQSSQTTQLYNNIFNYNLLNVLLLLKKQKAFTIINKKAMV